jgi:hypothetical protein
MTAPTIPGGATQAVQTQAGTYNFTVAWYAFFQSLLGYVSTGPIGPTPLVGVTDGSAAAAGNIGEYLSSIKTVSAGVAIVNSTATQITSLTLTAGDWDLWGEVVFDNPVGGAATFSYGEAAIWTTTAAFPTTSQFPADAADYAQEETPTGNNTGITLQLGPVRVSITTNTTYFLNAESVYSATSQKVGGALRARRRR